MECEIDDIVKLEVRENAGPQSFDEGIVIVKGLDNSVGIYVEGLTRGHNLDGALPEGWTCGWWITSFDIQSVHKDKSKETKEKADKYELTPTDGGWYCSATKTLPTGLEVRTTTETFNSAQEALLRIRQSFDISYKETFRLLFAAQSKNRPSFFETETSECGIIKYHPGWYLGEDDPKNGYYRLAEIADLPLHGISEIDFPNIGMKIIFYPVQFDIKEEL